MIPLTNAAGLLQCSPTNSNPSLTKPRYGALDLRAAAPTRINYIRVFPSDDIQGPAAAVFAHDDEKATSALVLDDTSAFGRNSADTFVKEFEELGGTTVRRSLNSGFTPADVTSALTPLSDGPKGASVVYYGGVSNTGGTRPPDCDGQRRLR